MSTTEYMKHIHTASRSINGAHLALFLSFSKGRQSRKGNMPPDHLKFLLSFFQTTAVYRTGRQKSHSGDISFYLSEIFLQISLFCLPLPGSIQVSAQSSGACTLCRHCTPAACYLRNVVKHLRESMTNTVSVTIQKQALEQALISSHPAAPK